MNLYADKMRHPTLHEILADVDFGWVCGDGICDATVPPKVTCVTYAGHTIQFEPTGMVGVDSGRVRTRVTCLTCPPDKSLIHEATTGPQERAANHWYRVIHG